MEGERLPIAALHGHAEGKRSRGRQRKIWMDNVKEDMKEKNNDLTRIGEATRNRGLVESYKSLIVSSLMEERKEEDSLQVNACVKLFLLNIAKRMLQTCYCQSSYFCHHS